MTARWPAAEAPVLAMALVILLTLAACTGDAPLDQAALEADIAAALVPTQPEAVTSVVCPDAADASAGDSIDCAVLIGSQELPVTAVLGPDGVAVTPGLPLLDGAAAAAQLAERFTTELDIATTVVCEQPLIVLAPDSEFECVATDDKGVSRALAVSVGSDSQLVIAIK